MERSLTRLCKCGVQLPSGAKKFCAECRAARRPLQLRSAHRRFLRKKKHGGRVSRNLFYAGKLTSWAVSYPGRALRLWHRRNGVAAPPPELLRLFLTLR